MSIRLDTILALDRQIDRMSNLSKTRVIASNTTTLYNSKKRHLNWSYDTVTQQQTQNSIAEHLAGRQTALLLAQEDKI